MYNFNKITFINIIVTPLYNILDPPLSADQLALKSITVAVQHLSDCPCVQMHRLAHNLNNMYMYMYTAINWTKRVNDLAGFILPRVS